MCKFVLEGDALTEEEGARVAAALGDVAEADAPLAVEMLLVDEEEIRELNARTRGIDKVTDVLSFPELELRLGEPILAEEHGEAIDEEGRILLGSVVLNEKRAREQAEEYGHSFEREKCYLLVHGVLHCLGYDHETDEEKAQMRLKEEEVMQRLNLGRDE